MRPLLGDAAGDVADAFTGVLRGLAAQVRTAVG
jgi:hypothetical protein